MPGRKYSAGSEYRYGFNGQEKSKEVFENSTSAEFWQYDARIGRRWNVDPVYKHSPYETFGGNPILMMDKNGADTLNIGYKAQDEKNNIARNASEKDILSLVKEENRKYVKFDVKGNVSIDKSQFPSGGVSPTNSDGGLQYLNLIIESEYNLSYSASPATSGDVKDLTTGIIEKNKRANLTDTYPIGSIISHEASKEIIEVGNSKFEVSDINKTMTNLSSTLRGDEKTNGNLQVMPNRRFSSGITSKVFDGQLNVGRGVYYNMDGGTKIVVSRASIVFHELVENFYRVCGSTYEVAHKAAIESERVSASKGFYNPNPGTTPQYFEVGN